MLQLYVHAATPMPELLAPVKNRMFIKPDGGLWTSAHDGQTSAWVDWCRAESFGAVDTLRWFVLSPDPAARILTIDSKADMDAMYARYFDDTCGLPFLSAIDFETMAHDYDAMRVTERGQWATRLSLPRSLYGWDCESTCWFRWCFIEVQEIPQRIVTKP